MVAGQKNQSQSALWKKNQTVSVNKIRTPFGELQGKFLVEVAQNYDNNEIENGRRNTRKHCLRGRCEIFVFSLAEEHRDADAVDNDSDDEYEHDGHLCTSIVTSAQ